MNPSVANARLARLRGFRCPPPPDRSIGAEVGRLARELRRSDRVLSRIEEVWEAAAPDALRTLARPVSFRAGVLELSCVAAAVRFEVDRWLQSGGREVVEKTLGTPIFRVKFVSGARAGGSGGERGNAGGRGEKRNNRVGQRERGF
ncbi:MAG TPA: hypothetical protein VF777_13000 [Phycisphaerales bacterium]